MAPKYTRSQLHVLYAPDGIPTLDLVAIHGLNGHYERTWTDNPDTKSRTPWLKDLLSKNLSRRHKDSGSERGSERPTLWLKDLLPEKLPRCRVMSFEYDSAVFGGGTGSIRSAATSLLQALRDSRDSQDHQDPKTTDTDETPKRPETNMTTKTDKTDEMTPYAEIPIVFVGHSLGGLVIKQCLSLASQDYQKMAECTKGILFLGTPHRGADAAERAIILRSIAGAVMRKPPSFFLEALRTNSDELYRISEDFLPFARNYAIFSFYEEYPHSRVYNEVVVNQYSAIIGLAHEQTMMLGGNHSSICRFSRGDKNFDTVCKRIVRASRGPGAM
ncbi:Alpha/Beta hydrolase protein [Nemania sp. FL0916]|nr:Alpha/Beta hydrolase protein [Nemania sp. FL0916]